MESWNLSLRQRKLLYIMQNQTSFITSTDLARQLQVSPRTIRSDISEINEKLEPFHTRIVSEKSKGYFFHSENPDILLKLNNIDNAFFTKEDRVRYLAFQLCLSDIPINIYDLEDEMFVSHTTLEHDLNEIKKELGDLLLHVVFYSKIGSEQKAFDLADVANGICDKLIFRHPHVFGNVRADNAEQVKQNWEDIKLQEKARDHKKKRVLSGVPQSLPAMVKAYRIGEKAASAGFDWEKREDVWKKVKEEVSEVQTELDRQDQERIESEFGDLFFSLINASRLYGVDPEAALERCNKKFIERFNHIEDRAEEQGVALRDMTLEQMDAFWNEAKDEESNNK